MYPVVEWKNNKVYMIDQRALPMEETFIEHNDYIEVAKSIKEMVIRGAPAIGVAAAMGIALGVLKTESDYEAEFEKIVETISSTRPTAVNLFWAAKRMKKVFNTYKNDIPLLKEKMVEEAITIDRDDVEINKNIGRNGHVLLETDQTVLTHCNAGALATGGYGTALGVIRRAWDQGKRFTVYADETRPRQQGARLTVWELHRDGIDVRLITDNMAASLMGAGRIDLAVTGADRVARNGDAANKIGTYGVAIACKHHGLPFYVAAPLSTLDPALADGSGIPIEERDGDEVRVINEAPVTVPGVPVENPGFDVTPAGLITRVITEHGAFAPEALDDYLREKGL